MLKKFQLKNGLKVLTVQSRKSPVVSVQMWVKTGSADEDKKIQGISHFIEHLVFKGTQKFGLGQIAATVEGSGGELNAYTTFDQTVFYVTISKDYLSTGLEIVSQMMGFPKFNDEDINNEREVVIEEIKRGNDNAHRQASRLLFETIYKKHPYGKPVIGYEEIIRKVPRQQILKYYRSRYVPKNMTLVVAGDFDFKDLKQQINSYYEPFEKFPLKKVRRTQEAKQNSPRVAVKKAAFQESLFYLSWPVPNVRHKDIPALDVLSLVLGQGESSRLNQALRLNENLVNYAGASTFTPKDAGFFAVSGSLTPDKFAQVLKTTGDEILKLRQHPVSVDELQKARINFASEEAYSLETVDGLARKVGTYNLLFDDPDYQKTFLKEVMAVTPLDIARMVEKYLNPKVLSVVLMTNSDEKPLQKIAQDWVKEFSKQWKASPKLQTKLFKALKTKALSVPRAKSSEQPILREVLPNGAILLVRPNSDAPTLSLRCGFLGGTRAEGMDHPGLTELLSRTWVTGTKQTPERDLYRKIEGMASSLNAFGGRNTVGLSLTTLPAFASVILDLLEQVLLEPMFPSEAIDREKLSVLEALRTRDDNPAQKAILNFMKALFANHPYSIDPLGDKDSVKRMKHADLSQFLSQHLAQKNCVVSISGYLDEATHLPRLRQIFSKLKKGERFHDQFRFSKPSQEQRQFESTKKEQAHLVIGYPGLSFKDPRRYALQLVQAVLAGQGGRLFLELRDKASLAYSVSPLRMEGMDCGYFGAYIGCSPEKVKTALSMLKQEFKKIAFEKISEKELERAKKYLVGRHHIDLQRNSAICSSLLFDEIYGLPYDESFHYAEKIRDVSAKDAQEVAQAIFSQQDVTSVVGPTSPW